MNEKASQPFVIYTDRGKLFKANIPTLLLGAVLTLLSSTPWCRTNILTKITAILSRTLLLLWGWLCIPTLLRLLYPEPIVTINQEGIAYRPPRTGPISASNSLIWVEMQALYICELTMKPRIGRKNIHRFLCILPKDVEAFLQHHTFINMTILVILMNQVGSPFIIPESMLPLPVDELFAHICTQYAHLIHDYGIELREEFKGSITASKKKPGETT